MNDNGYKDEKKFPQKGNFSTLPENKNQEYINQPNVRENFDSNNSLPKTDDLKKNIPSNNSNLNNIQSNKENNQLNRGKGFQNNAKNNPQNIARKNNMDNVKQQLVKEGAKKAADAFAGPLGGAAVEELSKTKVGKKILNETTNKLKNPFKTPKLFNTFGNGKKETEEEVDGEGDFTADLEKKIITFFSFGTVGISGCFTALIILALICLIIAPLFYIGELIGNVTNSLSMFGEKLGNLLTFRGWCSDVECEEKEKNDFYKKIEDVYEEYKSDPYFVTLNTDLITATLTYTDPFSTTPGTDGEIGDLENLLPSNFVDFKKSEKKVELLAKKMVSYCCYKNGAEYMAPNGEHMCKGSDGKLYEGIDYKCPDDVYETVIDEETGEEKKVLKEKYDQKYKLDIDRYREYLEDEFIEKFYYDNVQNENVESKVDRVVEEIFLRVGFFENISGGGGYAKVYAFCSGVTVVDSAGNTIGTYSLEDYVAGVVSAEAWGGQNIEAYKAQAVAARTYVLSRTDNCSVPIQSSQNNQVFDENIKDYAREAAQATAGQVLLYEDKIFSSEYDSFCYNDSSCSYGEENGKRYVNYTKLPNGENHKVYLSPKYYYMISGGHGRGMSQVASYEMADNGSKYDEILYFFYSPGVKISNMISFIDGSHVSSSQIIKDKDELSMRSDLYKQMGVVYIDGVAIDLSIIYSKSAGNLGQCVWYAKSRALELIYFSNLDNSSKIRAYKAIQATYQNGEGWFSASTLDVFQKSTDYTKPMPGAIVSWSSSKSAGADHNYGHVAIIESVDYTNKTVVVSDGYNKLGASGADTWANVAYRTRTLTFDQILNYKKGYTFNGYVYILGQGE